MKVKLLIIFILAISLLLGCSNKNENTVSTELYTEENSDSYSGESIGMSELQSYDLNNGNDLANENNNSSNIISENNRKIIKKADINLETVDFEEVVSKVEEYIKNFNGYIESSNIYQDGINNSNYKNNRTAEFIIRVPKDNFDAILSEYSKLGIVTNKRLYGDDVSSDYFDKESRLTVLNSQEKRYLEILEKSESISDIIEVEKALTDVRYEIEYLTGYLKKMDDLISFSTINLNIYEVNKISDVINEPKTLSNKISNTFKSSIKSLGEVVIAILLFFVAAIPFLILPIIIVIIIKKIRKDKEKSNNSNK